MKTFKAVFAVLFVMVLANASAASAAEMGAVPQSSCVQSQPNTPELNAQNAHQGGSAPLSFAFQSECHQIICSSNAECQGLPCIAAYCNLWFMGIQGNCAEW
jgi:hypothetical protein